MYSHLRAWRFAYACAETPVRSPRSATTSKHSYERAYERAEQLGSLWLSFAHGPGGGFGVRRPLRHLAWKLDLDAEQLRLMADILNRLKTARAQAELDRDRADADLADLYEAETYSPERAASALAQRADAITRLNTDTATALERIFDVLHVDQRREFARMLRAGEFAI